MVYRTPAARDSLATSSSSVGPQDWRTIATDKRVQAAAKIPRDWRLPQGLLNIVDPTSKVGVLHIPRECGILTGKELDITENYDAVALLKEIASGRLSSLEVTVAFCKRAAIAQQLVSLLCRSFKVSIANAGRRGVLQKRFSTRLLKEQSFWIVTFKRKESLSEHFTAYQSV